MSSANVPSYARPNIASRLPDYTNNTAEHIRQAFVPNSYTTLSSLSSILRNGGPTEPFKAGCKVSTTTFSDFVYTCSPYDLTDELSSIQRKEHEDRMRRIGGDQPFFAGYATYRGKFEEYHEMHYISDPYDCAIENERRVKHEEAAKNVSETPFVPTGKEKLLNHPTRAMLGDVMMSLYRTISGDWPDAQPTILSTAEDLIVIYFMLDRLKNEIGVVTYMNNALRRNDAVIEFNLRKVNEGWSVKTEDRHLLFTMRPPWVRQRDFMAAGASSSSALSNNSSVANSNSNRANQQQTPE